MAPTASKGRYVFLSYVREDSGRVDRLQQGLEKAGFSVWRDLRNILPGDDWRAALRDAITTRDITFVACFSRESSRRPASVMHDEIRWAAEEHRRRRPDRPWIFTALLDDVTVPEVDLGAGQTLSSFHYARLDRDWDGALGLLVEALRRRMNNLPDVPLPVGPREFVDVMTGLYSAFLALKPSVLTIEEALAKARSLWDLHEKMDEFGWGPKLVLVRHPELTEGRRTISEILFGRQRREPPPADLWDVELVAGVWSPDPAATTLSRLSDLARDLGLSETNDEELVSRFLPTIATVVAQRSTGSDWLAGTRRLLVRSGPGRQLGEGWKQLRFEPARTRVTNEHTFGGDYGPPVTVHVPEVFTVETARFKRPTPEQLLPLVRPSVAARELPPQAQH